ncbi:hypothetical protein L1049_006004 [Liquidambar formosana]|uniref:Uncharacterized protein n=1 Tax=Liquidambar formosana TaxID=63359 RepID=A0AAP0RES7_LIQFO
MEAVVEGPLVGNIVKAEKTLMQSKGDEEGTSVEMDKVPASVTSCERSFMETNSSDSSSTQNGQPHGGPYPMGIRIHMVSRISDTCPIVIRGQRIKFPELMPINEA